MCAFPDFTNARTRAWWGGHHAALLDQGVAGVWCDMNEPALFVPMQSTMPEDVVHPGDGAARLHAQVHNLYGSLMAQADARGLRSRRARTAARSSSPAPATPASSATRCTGPATTRRGGSTCG